jgi:hypothetical protein
LSYNWHAIKLHMLKVYNLICFEICTHPWSHPHSWNNEHVPLQKFLRALFMTPPSQRSSPHPVLGNYWSASCHSRLVCISYNFVWWNHLICMSPFFACLVSFSMILRFIHVVQGINSSFFSSLNSKIKFVKHLEGSQAYNECLVNGSYYYNDINKMLLKFANLYWSNR